MAVRIPAAHDSHVISARKLARARTQRKKFSSSKARSKIKFFFLLNKHGDLNFLSHNNSIYIILFNLKEM